VGLEVMVVPSADHAPKGYYRVTTQVALVSTIVLAVVAIIGSIGWVGGKRRENHSNDDDNDDEPFDPANAETTIPFPWEPKGKQHERLQQHIINPPNNEGRPTSSSSSSSSRAANEKQLELLASMTFANGGMRTPSCLCCI
jgi:hypothetical protein